MQINEIRIAGFKSFADPTDLRLLPGLTGIVGPNGCGKSNIVEAILWAMGETAPSSVRGSEMEDVIFAGGGSRPRRNHAEVSLVIEPGDIAVPGETEGVSEIEVSRKIQRKAGSTYRINGREVRGRDVQTMFGDAGTGARSCAIVRQNRIGELVNAKPESRRQLIEDAAGISGLHKRRHEIELRITATRRNLETVGEHLLQLERQARNIQRETRRAERYRDIATRLRQAEVLQALAGWRDETSNHTRHQSELAHAEAESGQAAAAASAAQRKLAEITDQLEPHRKAQLEAAAALARIEAEEQDLARRLSEAHTRLAGSEGQLREIEDDLIRETGLEEDAVRNLASLGNISAEDGKDPEFEVMLATAEAEEQALAEKLGEAESKSDTHTRAAAEISAQHAQLVRAETEAAVSLARLDGDLESLGKQLRQLQGEEERLAGDLGKVSKTQQAARHEAEVIEQRRRKLDEFHQESATLERDAEGTLAEARQRMAELEAESSATRRGLAGEEEGGKQGGEIAPVLDQLSVPPGLEAAIDVVAGDDLQLPETTGGAGVSGWHGLAPLGVVQPLPEGVQGLGELIKAPPVLARLFSQTGLVEQAEGSKLQKSLLAGQRLVSREGALWRWDGLCRYPGESGGHVRRTLEARRRLEPAGYKNRRSGRGRRGSDARAEARRGRACTGHRVAGRDGRGDRSR